MYASGQQRSIEFELGAVSRLQTRCLFMFVFLDDPDRVVLTTSLRLLQKIHHTFPDKCYRLYMFNAFVGRAVQVRRCRISGEPKKYGFRVVRT